MNLDPTHAEEIKRLEFQESDAERRYEEAVERHDTEGAVSAARDWKNACEALDIILNEPLVARAAEVSRSAATHESVR